MNKNQTSLEILEHNKRSNILFFEGKSVWGGCLSQWDDFLTSNYWKNWREKIKNFQNQDEMDFYVNRLSALVSFICQSVADKGWVNNKPDPRIKKEEERLENISEKEWKKEDKFADVGLREVSVEEALNDPWFSKEIDNIFGRENGKLLKEEKKPDKKSDKILTDLEKENNVNYKNWTKNQLISEINRLKAENEQLKNNQNLTSSERQARLQQNQNKLEQVESYIKVNSEQINSKQPQRDNKFIRTVGIIALISIIIAFSIAGIAVARKKMNKKVKK